MLTGIDVSHHNGFIIWESVELDTQHIEFAFIKCTEGVRFLDERFSYNTTAALNHIPVVGSYHFLRSDSDPVQQADHYFRNVEPVLDKTMCAVDVEFGRPDSYPTEEHTRRFWERFTDLSGNHPLFVYTGRWYWRDLLRNPYGANIGPLWHSAFTATPGAMYGGWDRLTIWQYTNHGKCLGIQSSGLDMNQFSGSIADLSAYIRSPFDPIGIQEKDETMIVVNESNGAALHVIGSHTILIDNPADLADYGRAGIPIVRVKQSQFSRYEKLRLDVAKPA